jgi:hypothetical protein
MISASLEPDDRGERQRLVDHLQDRHGPGLKIADAATLDFLTQMHDRLHDAQGCAGRWPGGSEGPHEKPDPTSWNDTERILTHLSRTHGIDTVTYPDSLAKLRDLHDQVHDDAYRHRPRSPDELDPRRDHDRSDLT